jgi:hypothetical protein
MRHLWLVKNKQGLLLHVKQATSWTSSLVVLLDISQYFVLCKPEANANIPKLK